MKKMAWVAVPLLMFMTGWYGHKYATLREGDTYAALTRVVREKSSQYQYTNASLFTDNSAIVYDKLDPLQNRLDEYRKIAIANGDASAISIYFRDLNNSSWTGVGEEDLYDPASLQKVTLLVAYLKEAETDPSVLEKDLYYEGNTDGDEYYKTTHTLKKGQNYPVKDLLIDMISKSGNDSTSVLFNNMDKNELTKVYEDLELPFPKKDTPELLSPRMYSRLFRVLYNASYVEHDLSEEALHLLAQTEFDKGLKAPLPQSLVVAHKFGERTTTLPDHTVEHQLHDCGIIYFPDHPYFLCVMTKGTDFTKLQGVIAHISQLTYEYWKPGW